MKSNYYCAQKYCTPEEAQAGRDKLSLSCEKNVGFGLASVAEYTLTAEELANVPVLNETAALATATDPLNTTAIPDADFFQLGYQTEKDFYITWDLCFNFSFALIGFWGFVILVGMVHRMLNFIKKPSDSKNSGLRLWIRRTLILPATFGKRQAEAIVATGKSEQFFILSIRAKTRAAASRTAYLEQHPPSRWTSALRRRCPFHCLPISKTCAYRLL